MSLGSESMKDIGNVYCAALPAWMAAGMEDAQLRGLDLAGGKVLAVGYGSGDAAEAIPMTVMEGWARRRGAHRLRSGARALPEPDARPVRELCTRRAMPKGSRRPTKGFVIESIGSSSNPRFSDEGIEYYRYLT